MPKISAIIHARNDEQRIARALESLRPCDEVVVVDHNSTDRTADVAREHGARVRPGVLGVQPGAYLNDLRHDWVLSLLPNEAVSEALEATLFEWKNAEPPECAIGYNACVREETDSGWRNGEVHLRLANRRRINWVEELPPADVQAPRLSGDILRFRNP
jgi:glycosyltransferase involved in cell wall biosynthesis